jgi:hypothetical protein
MAKCQICGGDIPRNPNRGKKNQNKKYCSENCRRAGRGRSFKKWYERSKALGIPGYVITADFDENFSCSQYLKHSKVKHHDLAHFEPLNELHDRYHHPDKGCHCVYSPVQTFASGGDIRCVLRKYFCMTHQTPIQLTGWEFGWHLGYNSRTNEGLAEFAKFFSTYKW